MVLKVLEMKPFFSLAQSTHTEDMDVDAALIQEALSFSNGVGEDEEAEHLRLKMIRW